MDFMGNTIQKKLKIRYVLTLEIGKEKITEIMERLGVMNK